LQDLELWLQLEREMGSPASPGNDRGKVAEDRGKISLVKKVCSLSLPVSILTRCLKAEGSA